MSLDYMEDTSQSCLTGSAIPLCTPLASWHFPARHGLSIQTQQPPTLRLQLVAHTR